MLARKNSRKSECEDSMLRIVSKDLHLMKRKKPRQVILDVQLRIRQSVGRALERTGANIQK